MPSYAGGKVRVAIKRLNLRRLPISSHSHETRSTTHNNFRGVYVAFGDRLSYGAGLPFHVRWDRIQRNLALLGRVSAGNTVVPYRESGEAFRAMWAAVDGARQSVLWQTYICKDDRVGRMTVKKMEAAHTRGCRTELLFDCGGNITGRRRLTEKLKESGATVIEHRPVFDQILPYFLGGMKWERSPGIRNHRKILLVDSEIGFCGGLNIGNEYCGRTQGGTGRFRDTHCSVVGPAVAHLREVYDDTKAPKPWKWGWTRWHKIAAAAMNLRYKEGKNATNDILLPMTQSMQEKGSMYLHRQMEKAEQNTARFMERIRWKRQRERLESFMRWYPKNRKMTNKGNGIEGRHNPDDEPKSGLQSIDNNINNSNNNNNNINNINNSNKDVTPSTTMKEKIERYRVRPFNTVKVAFKKRLGRKVPPVSPPLSDTDPVPGAEQYSKTRPNVTQILCCNPHSRDWSIPYAFWRVSQKAYGRLWVTTPYYMPHRKLLHALLHAARRGVDVRILAGSNYTTDPWFMWYASNYITERLLAAGVRVYEYKGGQVMHAKTVVVDSIWCSVGSYNWDMMSNKNMEVCLCHLSYELAREMERHFIQDLQVSKELKYDEYRCRSLWLRFASWFFYIGLQILEKLAFHTYRNEDLSSEVDDLD